MKGYIIEHRRGRATISQRADDGYICATDLCRRTTCTPRSILIKRTAVECAEAVEYLELVNPVSLAASGERGLAPDHAGTWIHSTLAPLFVRHIDTPDLDGLLYAVCTYVEAWRTATADTCGTDALDAETFQELRPFIIARLAAKYSARANVYYATPFYVEILDVVLTGALILVHPFDHWEMALVRAAYAASMMCRTIAVYLYGPGNRRRVAFRYAKRGVILLSRDPRVELYEGQAISSEWLLCLDL